MHKHHRKRRSQGGGDEAFNVIEIPAAFHEWIHANVERAYELGLLVRSHEDPAEVSVIIPESVIEVKKTKVKKAPEKTRAKATVGIKVPMDARENGAEVLQTLIEECRQAIKEVLGFQDDVPAYFVLVSVLYAWLKGHNIETSVEDVPKR